MTVNCLLCGVGGQGTVLASKLIAFGAMEKGMRVRTAETIGMAQRGGCVVSHVRVGDEIHSPLIPKGAADVLVAFEPAEAVRCLSYLKTGGTVVVNAKAVKPVTATLTGSAYDGQEMIEYLKKNVPDVVVMDGEKICRQCGSPKVLNVVLLAAAAKTGSLGLTVQELREALAKRLPERYLAMNLKAVDLVCGEAQQCEAVPEAQSAGQ